MGNPIEFKDYEYDDANNLLTENSLEPPTKDCIGYFEADRGGQFYWFKNEEDLRFWLLNGWYGRSTEERDKDYYNGVKILKDFLESDIKADKMWSQMPDNVFSESEVLWSGYIRQLLTVDCDFAERIREEFKTYMIRNANSLPPSVRWFKMGNDPPIPEILDLLVKFVTGYCW